MKLFLNQGVLFRVTHTDSQALWREAAAFTTLTFVLQPLLDAVGEGPLHSDQIDPVKYGALPVTITCSSIETQEADCEEEKNTDGWEDGKAPGIKWRVQSFFSKEKTNVLYLKPPTIG